MERRTFSYFCLIALLFTGLSAHAWSNLTRNDDVSIQSLYPKGFVNQCLKMTTGTVVGWDACGTAGNGGTLGSINNGNALIAIANGTGYYTTITPVATLSSYTNDAGWTSNTGTVTSVSNGDRFLAVANKTTIPSITFLSQGSAAWATKFSDEVGTGRLTFNGSPTFSTPTLGAASATSINSTTIPSSKTLVVTTDKLSALAATTSLELTGVISDEIGSGRLLLNGSPILSKTITLNGNTLSIPAVNQGAILVSKVNSSLLLLNNGANHSVLKVNGKVLVWEAEASGGSSNWTDEGSWIHPATVNDTVSIKASNSNGSLFLNGDIALQSTTTPTLDMMGDYPRMYVKTSTGNLTFLKWDGMTQTEYNLIPSGTSVTSGGTSTDNHVPVWVGTGGNSLEDSPVVVDPMMGDMTGVGSIAIGGGMSTPLVVSTNNLVADGSNVGVGTASPDHKLDVVGTSEFSDQIDITNNKYLSWSDGMSYTNILGLNSSNDLILQGSSGMMSGGNIIIKPAQAEALRLDKNGNVGIHDQTPDALLDVNGAAIFKSFTLNGTTVSLPSLTQGDILFSKVAANINRLAKGTNHYTLMTNGNTLAWESRPAFTSKLSAFAATSSSELAGVISDEIGTGRLVFNGSPTFATPVLGSATATKVIASGSVNGSTVTAKNLALSNGAYATTVMTIGNGGTAKTIQFGQSLNFAISLNATPLAITAGTDPTGDTRFAMAINQRAGSQTVTWTACASANGFCWPGGTAPTITAAANAIDIISCWYRVAKDRYYCVASQDLK